MPAEKFVHDFVKEAGYNPIPDRAIIVTYAPADLSEKWPVFSPMSSSHCKCAKILWCCCRSDGCPWS